MEDIWYYELSTPIMTIRHYLFEVVGGTGVFCLSQKNIFNVQGVLKIKDFLNCIKSADLPDNDISLYQSNDLEISQFDTIVVLHGKYHNFFKFDVPCVYLKTYVVFPCHHSEFVNNISDEEVNFARNKIVNTMVWNREVSPRIKMYFENDSNGVKTTGSEPLLCDASYVFDVIDQLAVDKGRLTLVNYKFESIKLEFLNNRIQIEGKSNKDFDTLQSTKEWLRCFFQN